MADVILAEQLFGSIGCTIVANSDISKILSLMPDVRRKQVKNEIHGKTVRERERNREWSMVYKQ